MAHGLQLVVAESLRALALTSPIQAALVAEFGSDRCANVIARVLDAMTPEDRRAAVLASMAGHAQLAADVMRLDADGEYDRGADLLGNAAGSLRQATGTQPARRRDLGAVD